MIEGVRGEVKELTLSYIGYITEPTARSDVPAA
jgi:hypothetical protein